MFNELFWSLAVTMRNQCYATRGLDVVAAQTVATTVHNFVSVVWMSIGFSIAIIVGNLLGAGKVEEARDTGTKMIALSVVVGVGLGAIMASLSHVFPLLFGVEPAVFELSAFMLITLGILTPVMALCHAAYFTLRTGGKIFITVMLDSVFMWVVAVPLTFCLSSFTNLAIEPLFVLSQFAELIKCVIALFLIWKVNWASQIVDEDIATVDAPSERTIPDKAEITAEIDS